MVRGVKVLRRNTFGPEAQDLHVNSLRQVEVHLAADRPRGGTNGPCEQPRISLDVTPKPAVEMQVLEQGKLFGRQVELPADQPREACFDRLASAQGRRILMRNRHCDAHGRQNLGHVHLVALEKLLHGAHRLHRVRAHAFQCAHQVPVACTPDHVPSVAFLDQVSKLTIGADVFWPASPPATLAVGERVPDHLRGVHAAGLAHGHAIVLEGGLRRAHE
mmetsp:Transcript_59573/g.153416  ORF Transcript_59573/g.153416 Transcript_59573/m.153416 type:complete len:218 (+) Transcript_59573:943-1596(+)